ncbi:MAG: response regulator [Rhodospirillaceae bacterium]|jgi:CheY-like chemotaxis protein|nr:response regulator [Rhodospirillaceae bacterium]MBT4220054.1 response regulator [Rhodospirillaceae bacterium]MBT4463485.1 response regulator [Rhodospirillaceae bacterium]MBT5013042.1 response regulator [Rhodospirillaceae bacterium]MBT5309698.1 response regulator [Rhodospirillaceae bacterium]
MAANKALIVDDDGDILDFLGDILDDEISVSYAPSGEKALEMVHLYKPNLILLDIQMPGMDGFEVCRRLKENEATRHIPVIFLSAMDDDKDIEEGLRLGAVDYITKPFDPKIVIAKVKNQLAQIAALQGTQRERRATEPGEDRRAESVPGSDRRGASSVDAATHEENGNLGVFLKTAVASLILFGGVYVGFTYFTAPSQAPAPVAKKQTSWPFNSKCDKAPIVSWWGNTTHFSMANYVDRRHSGNWAPYIDKWTNQLNKLRDISSRGRSVTSSDGTVMSGQLLKDHIVKLEKRVSVIQCLADEDKTTNR